MSAQFLYGGAGILLFALGLWSLLVHEALLRKLIAINIAGGGVFHVFIAIAYRGDTAPPDPVPHALVLTGIVVAVSATALVLALHRRLEQAEESAADAEGRSESASASSAAPPPRTPTERNSADLTPADLTPETLHPETPHG
jgi:multicomponent Na+:H+ antiporter subunit C